MKLCNWMMACAMVASGLVFTGCDPNGPGASGLVRLDSNLTPSDFKTLELRANPDSSKTFDLTNPTFPEKSDWSWTSDDLSKMEFPYEYEIDGGIGNTSKRDWRLFAWLSKAGNTETPQTGEPFGTISFSVAECGTVVKGYCGVTEEVNVTINNTVP